MPSKPAANVGTVTHHSWVSEEIRCEIDGACFMFLFLCFSLAGYRLVRDAGVRDSGSGGVLDQKVQVS